MVALISEARKRIFCIFQLDFMKYKMEQNVSIFDPNFNVSHLKRLNIEVLGIHYQNRTRLKTFRGDKNAILLYTCHITSGPFLYPWINKHAILGRFWP